MISQSDLENWFTYHSPSPEQQLKYKALRDKAKELAALIVEMTPSCQDQTTAIRTLREAIHWANASIACGGK